MDQNVAQQLLTEGATFVLLGVPEGTEFGIDLKMWTTGQNFRGVKMIPPGIHFVHYSAVDAYGCLAPKVGFFYHFHKAEFVVRKWDREKEDISGESIDEGEVVSLKDSICLLDSFLGPYPYDILKKWVSLTNCIADNLIAKLTPLSGQIRSALELQSCTDSNRPRSKNFNLETGPSTSTDQSPRRSQSIEKLEQEMLPDLKPFPGTELQLSEFPEKSYPDGSTPSEVTRHSLDSTYILEILIDQHTSDSDLIGELQFSYICFLVGQSFEAFEHWKKLVITLCSCQSAIKKHRHIYDQFVSTLEAQILETPEEFLADIVANNNFVYVKLRTFFRNVLDSDIDRRFKAKVERFRRSLTTQYGWDFSHLESEDEDEAPVIVET